jgi:hypothetical protein
MRLSSLILLANALFAQTEYDTRIQSCRLIRPCPVALKTCAITLRSFNADSGAAARIQHFPWPVM